MHIDRMRNLHLHIEKKFGRENVFLLRKCEDLVRKIMDFGNHRKFMLRCLVECITSVSEKLKNTVITSKSYQIIRKAERQLLNEHVSTINNTIELSDLQSNTCIEQLSRVLDD